ncbi:transcriptional regulator [Leucothrix pacifica]|uniref:Transcriptional regulator n=1 Tax=Leucothrix pacifica TaxID=1247513 RepID=A0A317C416_9GAMM|nr:transcriptional regulator [Leucothrix pacifica]PWQ92113.1 transcriptional regulator [Leucothrix pacifica]
MKVMNVGIMSREDYKNRTIAIARGVYKPKPSEPKVWFESIKSLSQVLSNENQELLKLIVERKPQSLTELEQISHRKKSNLSRTLKTLENYGIVSLTKESGKVVPTVQATDFEVKFGLNTAAY